MPSPYAMAADALDPATSGVRAWYCQLADCDGSPHEPFNYPHARAAQRPPPGDWDVWWIRAGRGFGKTRAGAEWAREQVERQPRSRGALVGATYADARDTMVEGETGLLAVLPPSLLRGGSVEDTWHRSLGELLFANSARAKLFSSEKPGRLRGPQHHWAWGDEPAEWLDADVEPKTGTRGTTYSNLAFGLRLGDRAPLVLTGTPKTVHLIVGLLHTDPAERDSPPPAGVAVTRGTTYDNLAYLTPGYRRTVVDPYAGTTLGRQELDAELLDDDPRAMWQRAQIAADRAALAPELALVAVGVDPPGSTAEAGIVVAGRAEKSAGRSRLRHGYVLADHSRTGSPADWGRAAVLAWHAHQADVIAAEANYGGEMVKATVLGAAAALIAEHADEVERGDRAEVDAVTTTPHVVLVHATRGKAVRAEPIAAAYEQHRIHHAGTFPRLEDQMCTWVKGESRWSPDRLDALVWACTYLGLGVGDQTGTYGGLAVAQARVG
jgi:phage terminase large subunit-like protein